MLWGTETSADDVSNNNFRSPVPSGQITVDRIGPVMVGVLDGVRQVVTASVGALRAGNRMAV